MNATVGLEGLAIDCIIGAHACERDEPQRILVDVELDVDAEAAAVSDELGDAVDYQAVAEILIAMARDRRFQLLERFAAEAVERVMASFPKVRRVVLEVKKPSAVPSARWAFVRLERDRSGEV